MNHRNAFIAKPLWWKTAFGIIGALVFIAGCLLLVLMPASAAECMQVGGPGCPRRIYPRTPLLGMAVFLAWLALPCFVFATWRFIRLRATNAPFLLIDSERILCREWPAPIALRDVTEVEIRTVPIFLWFPWLGHRFWIQLRTKPDEEWYADIGFRGVLRRFVSRMRLELIFYDMKTGRYNLRLRGLDQPQAAVVKALEERLGPRVMWT